MAVALAAGKLGTFGALHLARRASTAGGPEERVCARRCRGGSGGLRRSGRSIGPLKGLVGAKRCTGGRRGSGSGAHAKAGVAADRHRWKGERRHHRPRSDSPGWSSGRRPNGQ
jgi:hypothetical protein